MEIDALATDDQWTWPPLSGKKSARPPASLPPGALGWPAVRVLRGTRLCRVREARGAGAPRHGKPQGKPRNSRMARKGSPPAGLVVAGLAEAGGCFSDPRPQRGRLQLNPRILDIELSLPPARGRAGSIPIRRVTAPAYRRLEIGCLMLKRVAGCRCRLPVEGCRFAEHRPPVPDLLAPLLRTSDFRPRLQNPPPFPIIRSNTGKR